MDNNQLQARTEFAAAINQICEERNISPDVVIDSIKAALIASFHKDYPSQYEQIEEDGKVVKAELDPHSGEFRLYAGEEDQTLKESKDITPPGFGRIAAQTAKQVILQKVREAEKSATIDEYRDRVGQLISGMILRLDGKNVIVDLGRGQAFMPAEEQIKNEFYRLNSRFSFVIADIRETHRGETIIVSRSDPRLVERIFEREVPEVSSGAVVIRSIAREAGVRTKIAVDSTQDGVDPVGSCVGQKGVRVQAVINDLNGEKIDIVPFSQDLKEFVKAALSPAEGLSMIIDKDKNTATVTVPHDQLSLAIGRSGQNVRLAAKLTRVAINITSDQTDTQIKVTGDEEFEIDQLDLDKKVRNLLVEAGYRQIESLLANIDKLSEIKGLAEKSVGEIKAKLQAYKPPKTEESETESETEKTESQKEASAQKQSISETKTAEKKETEVKAPQEQEEDNQTENTNE